MGSGYWFQHNLANSKVVLSTAVLGLLLALSGCGYQGSLGKVACDDDLDCPDNSSCEAGFCVFDGDIECDDHQIVCDGGCVDPETSNDHCGSCGNLCFDGENCQSGSCLPEPECADGLSACGEYCVDTDSDADHCGDCFSPCGSDEVCQAGQCEPTGVQCEDGLVRCGEDCVDLASDDAHCGDCFDACSADQSCSDSLCQCPSNQQLCGDQCVDTTSNRDFCGDCETACESHEFCYDGECTDECDETQDDQLLCDDSCINPQTNTSYCGDCDTSCVDVSGADVSCISGNCIYNCEQSDQGAQLCLEQATCAILDSDVDHCGDCGRQCETVAGATRSCDDGRCQYECNDADSLYCGGPDGADDTGQGQCVDVTTSLDHCQGCDNACADDGPENSQPVCGDQGCTYECSGGLSYCDDEEPGVDEAICADLDSDVDHCGQCGNSCGPVANGSSECNGGTCDIVCDQNYGQCVADTCIDLMNTDAHCGQCGNSCGADEQCVEGGCEPLLACTQSPSQSDPFYPFGGGSGTAGDPFTICTAAQLGSIDDDDDYLTRHFILADHIELGGQSFESLTRGNIDGGVASNGFAGHFDGNDFEIRDLTITQGGTNRVGLFGMIQGGTLENVVVVGGQVQGAVYTGGLVGVNLGKLINSSFEGTVTGTYRVGGIVGGHDQSSTLEDVYFDGAVSGISRVGGVVGHSGGPVIDAHSDGDVTGSGVEVGGLVGFARVPALIDGGQVGTSTQGAPQVTGTSQVGGLVGNNQGTIHDSTTYADVTGAEYDIGGLAGRNDNEGPTCSITNSHAHGRVAAAGNPSFVGGLVGYHLNHCSISQSSATGAVDVPSSVYVGGLVGYSRPFATIVGSHATGDVTGHNSVGGLAGRVASVDGEDWDETEAPVQNSYAEGDVTANNDAGGLVGRLEGTVSGSYATGVVDGAYRVGGLVGHIRITAWGTHGTVVDSHATGDVFGNDDVGGLVGLQEGDVFGSYAEGSVTGYDRVGGLTGQNPATSGGNFWADNQWVAGWSRRSRIVESYATGTISATMRTGGLVGDNGGAVERSFASGSVIGGELTGGLIGNHLAASVVTDSYATGDVSGTSRVGGLIGRVWGGGWDGTDGLVERTYSTGSVTGTGGEVGELIGRNRGDVYASFWRTTTPDDDESEGGSPLSPAEFSNSASFTAAGWTFPAPWTMGSTRPYLTIIPEP